MNLPKRIAEWFKGLGKAFERRVTIPLMQWIVGFFSGKLKGRAQSAEALPDWKKDVLQDFRYWLEELPDARGTEGEGAMDACDLFTLLSEFTALRQEIRFQNREQNRSLQNLVAIIDAFHDASDIFKEKAQEINGLEERIRITAEKKAILPFLEVRDALVRGKKASQEVAATKGFLRSAPKGIEGVIEGYEMAIRRFDRSLALVEIEPVETVSRPFDPSVMKAVGRKAAPGKESGIVVEEQLSGFVRGQEVIRYAEVVVCE